MKLQVAQGVNLTAKPQTLATFFASWITDTFAQSAAPKSFASYRWAAKRINAAFGDKRIDKLTGQQLQAFFSRMSTAGKTVKRDGATVQVGMAPKSVRLMHTVLHAALDQALKQPPHVAP